MPEDNKQEKPKKRQSRKRVKKEKRNANLLLATESAIERLEYMARPGGEIESMDIKDLKSFISSIKDLTTVSAELEGEPDSGGVIILPEVKELE